MRKTLTACLRASAALSALLAFTFAAHSQVTNIIVANFDTTNEVSGPPWGNWFGGAYGGVVWDSTVDANNNPNSGSILITGNFTGGGQQYFVFDSYGGINPPIDGSTVTNFQCDIRFDPSSCTTAGGTFGNMAFGTRGTGFSQPSFGAFSVSSTNTNWVHVSLPVNVVAQPLFATIPDVTIQVHTFGAAMNGTSKLWVDNIKFTGPLGGVSNPPPRLTILTSKPGLRIFAGSTGTIYDREELATVDQNQSWIGGTFPVSYSFTVLSYPNDVNLGQTHIFLLPVTTAPGGPYSYNGIDFTAGNNLWLNIAPLGGGNFRSTIAWKTNLYNANPDHTALVITNSSVVGKWTLTFTGETNGTLTAPGASPVAFNIADANIAADFGNPLVAFFGLQPNGTAGEGEYEDWGSITVTNVVGVNESEDFTQESALSPVWQNMSALQASLVLVTTNTPYWVRWTVPDDGFGLGTKAGVGSTNDWFTPAFYAAYGSDTPVSTRMGTTFKWTLMPNAALPTVNGSELGVPATKAIFRLSNPPPAQ